MPKYIVRVDIELYHATEIEVEAGNEEDAMDRAIEVAEDKRSRGEYGDPAQYWEANINPWEVEEVE